MFGHVAGGMGSIFGRIAEEQPRFKTIRATPLYQVRDYAPATVIETDGREFMR